MDLHIIVFSEDQGAAATQVVKAFAKRLFQHIEPSVPTQSLNFVPDLNHRSVMSGNSWKGKKTTPETVRLRQAIANYLREPKAFVVFHTDGDTKWSNFEGSENRALFVKNIVRPVKVLLSGAKLNGAQMTPTDVDLAAARLLHVVPHYSIEAWLYQNIERCRYYGKPGDHALLDSWEKDPAALDEVLMPKESLTFGSRYSHDLATTNFPTQRLHAAKASFVACAEQFKANVQLAEQLKNLSNPNDVGTTV